ncbi:MAG: hypothetical protein EX254_10070 [Flavobacteriaceae bacterium]|nr:MAG: hypothetical protein EX254_10070 [Flavobacteriaceae bacterium]
MSWLSKLFGRQHDCEQTLINLQTLLDSELSKEEEDRLIAEINKCPACLRHYNVEQSFKTFVKNRCKKKVDPRVLENIRTLVEETGREA